MLRYVHSHTKAASAQWPKSFAEGHKRRALSFAPFSNSTLLNNRFHPPFGSYPATWCIPNKWLLANFWLLVVLWLHLEQDPYFRTCTWESRSIWNKLPENGLIGYRNAKSLCVTPRRASQVAQPLMGYEVKGNHFTSVSINSVIEQDEHYLSPSNKTLSAVCDRE
jgi:hypothetical protein